MNCRFMVMSYFRQCPIMPSTSYNNELESNPRRLSQEASTLTNATNASQVHWESVSQIASSPNLILYDELSANETYQRGSNYDAI